MGTQPLHTKGRRPPIFGPCLLWRNGWVDQDATWYRARPRSKRYCVTCGPSSPSPKRARSPLPNFRSMSIVAKQLDGSRWHLGWRWALVQATLCSLPQTGTEPPIFGPSLLWRNVWVHQDATWYKGRPQPRRLCVRWDPAPLPKRGRSPRIFGPCLLWPNGWMDQDAT